MTGDSSPFLDTWAVMSPGECLMLGGGTFPNANESAEVTVLLSELVPTLFVLHPEKHPGRPNPAASEPVTVTLERTDKKVAYDYGDNVPDAGYAKGGGRVMGQTVDIWLVGGALGSPGPPIVFLGKP